MRPSASEPGPYADGGKQPTARLRCSNAAEESDARRPATVSRIGDADAIALHV